MDMFRKSANKLREQVVKQQHAVLKQLGGHGSGSDVIIDEAESQRHQQLEKLYASTRAAKHFQRELVRGVEGIVSTGSKQLEVANKLADECKKYGTEGVGVGGALSKASLQYGTAKIQMEKERDSMHRVLSTQVADPLRAMVNGAPLEDARQLTQRYDRLRQEAETQASEVSKRRTKDAGGLENVVKLQVAETKMQELSSSMAVLGKEAASAMTAVEAQQQRLTLQRIIALVHAEQAYHQRAAEILDQLQDHLVSELQHSEASVPSSGTTVKTPTFVDADIGDAVQTKRSQTRNYFIAEVTHPFEAESHGELSLSVGDFVVVRQVAPSGWSEGECKGQAGWFPSSYVEARQRMPGDKVTEGFSGV
ncbi:SH3 domain-containing protein 2 [Physcomitrium patens]|uniref:SH3 domain-containing protein n=1 Tax=Physcomitrium patens TaxID=3218 RepID=A9TB80_PHYPA|nr:SH3 domain-containing protein 2-like [Physcomitrium patens]XP_024399353.1 SH3 domain-containing protein 2-like [Physcomitrium patens]XP_024399354.1 SH3 domain-containing protein 2-like [Physcomitrium patens]XP_024399355.1 SH3 domain-containing protein 2-like [Physcomitrium patens]XP_024399356.1 SH3 domain-containing protein 2-like [Physcomitrium patens]XP_024399357.1 SH3 domain-containing protein 2-like [Physcomitrium patens]XP_024399359.1 SH3 domain-containing protein 2-like [Physcomitriu|eukprot:XP_024399352.1 SH3 domain-containing protein 2-like [Physcomitrella patens]